MVLKKILEKVEYSLICGSVDIDIADIAYDSRKVVESGMFVALYGSVVDGHKYIESAIDKGAAAVVAERDVELTLIEKCKKSGVTLIRVEDGRYTLGVMSAAYFDYPAQKLITIGITGTKGKSSVEHMIKDIIEKSGEKCGIIGTIGAFIDGESIPTENTTPESYELHKMFAHMVEKGCKYMIMEVSSQGIKMNRVAGIFYDYGVFTNISPDHIGPNEHADFDEYLMYKSKLFENCKIGIFNKDDEHFDEITKNATCEIVTFGKSDADMIATEIEHVQDQDSLAMKFEASGILQGEIVVGLPGYFNVYNAMCAACVGAKLGIDKDVILHGLEHVKIAGRVESIPTGGNFAVIVDYAHNGISTESVLKTLRGYNPRRLVAIFGCGGNRSKLRRYEMGEAVGRYADLAVITSDNPRTEDVNNIVEDILVGIGKTDGKYEIIIDRTEAVKYAIDNAEEGDIIILLGKGHEDYQEINGVKYHYSDREAVLSALEN
ncbi:MAG: UDP-N-acetylmuramoyl-L-alanyl-D-glutamate--2,6-diaminopimelate ligase [Eubacterium sp.]|nr:UDP-N-acetylmuramoyl-L-alanyl-D-glutamate--2,6-diaminopimelate ligase [Eubacterium sp.]